MAAYFLSPNQIIINLIRKGTFYLLIFRENKGFYTEEIFCEINPNI